MTAVVTWDWNTPGEQQNQEERNPQTDPLFDRRRWCSCHFVPTFQRLGPRLCHFLTFWQLSLQGLGWGEDFVGDSRLYGRWRKFPLAKLSDVGSAVCA